MYEMIKKHLEQAEAKQLIEQAEAAVANAQTQDTAATLALIAIAKSLSGIDETLRFIGTGVEMINDRMRSR